MKLTLEPNNRGINFEQYGAQNLPLIDRYIHQTVIQLSESASARFTPLIEAMQYSLGSRGKRLRPLLVLAASEYLDIPAERVLPLACAIEYIHTYSLIHDDLPAMDNDDERRGQPSSHKKFGEAVAILAGDALLTEAFGQLMALSPNFPADRVLRLCQMLATQAGVRGLVGGQLLDVTLDHGQFTLPELEFIHIHKTGALIVASVLGPAWLSDVDPKKQAALKVYGEAIGLAFQISDDVLDSEPTLRYSRGPRSKPKACYGQLMGMTESKERLKDLVDRAVNAIQDISPKANVGALVGIAEFIKVRKK